MISRRASCLAGTEVGLLSKMELRAARLLGTLLHGSGPPTLEVLGGKTDPATSWEPPSAFNARAGRLLRKDAQAMSDPPGYHES